MASSFQTSNEGRKGGGSPNRAINRTPLRRHDVPSTKPKSVSQRPPSTISNKSNATIFSGSSERNKTSDRYQPTGAYIYRGRGGYALLSAAIIQFGLAPSTSSPYRVVPGPNVRVDEKQLEVHQRCIIFVVQGPGLLWTRDGNQGVSWRDGKVCTVGRLGRAKMEAPKALLSSGGGGGTKHDDRWRLRVRGLNKVQGQHDDYNNRSIIS
jgi:hypothetical protein